MVIKINVEKSFVNRKVAIDWKNAGMRKGSDKEWLEGLEEAICPFKDQLRRMFCSKKKLKIDVLICDKSKK